MDNPDEVAPEAAAVGAPALDLAAFLEAARAPSGTTGKHDLVLRECRGRTVLDVGCIDHDADAALRPRTAWLHGEIREVAASVIGLDMLAGDVARLVEAGFDIVVGDAEDFHLGRTFDVVVGADIIEHLADPGGFLRSAREHMAPASRLVLTTPNPFAIARFAQALLRNRVDVNAEHTAWFDPTVLYELLLRNGLVPTAFAWLHDDLGGGSRASHVLDALTGPVLRRRPLLRRSFAVVARPS